VRVTGQRLARRLGLADAVVIGLGSMLGAGVFVAFAPATRAAGGIGVLLGLALAAFVAFCNARSSARLAALYPESGGTYVYGRERLGEGWGFLAGWAFVAGKTASCAAMALAIGSYAAPDHARLVAIAAVAVLTAVNAGGITKTARLTRILVVVTLGVLALVVVAGLGAGEPSLEAGATPTAFGVLQAAGLLFFAFAGYARIATLGEEVRDPQRTIPRAIPLALGVVLVIYAVIGLTALAVLGPDRLAGATAPLADVVAAAGVPALTGLARAGAVVAVVGVLLSLIAGVGRTTLAMARRGDLPRALSTVDSRRQVPLRAELAVAAVVIALVSIGDLRTAIGFSSCTVLVYYAVTNASAFTLGRGRVLAVAGFTGCLVLAASVPWQSLAAGVAVLVVGLGVRRALRWRRPR
jgi:APA family basic amino acid/polyamine antiporter